MNVYNPRDQQCAIGRTEYRNSKCAVNYAHPPPKHKFRMVIDATSVLLMAIIITSSVSAQFWLDNRFQVGDYPISVLDVVALCYGIYGVFGWIKSPPKKIDRIGRTLVVWFCYTTVVGLYLGYSKGNPSYAVLQEYRLVFYTLIGYFVTLATFRPKKHLYSVGLAIVVSGILVTVWQMVITLTGRGMLVNEMVFYTQDDLGRSLRDVNLPLYCAASAAVLVGVVLLNAPYILGRARKLAWLFIMWLLLVPLLSMTRTIWVAVLLSSIFLLGYTAVTHWRKKELWRLLFIFTMTGFALIFALFLFQTSIPTVYEGLVATLIHTTSGYDKTLAQRVATPQMVWDELTSMQYATWTGVGFGNMWSGSRYVGALNDVHNAYLAYMVISGLPGALIVIYLYCQPVRAFRWVCVSSTEPFVKAMSLAFLLNWIVYAVLLLAMPPHWSEAVWLGVLMGIASVMLKEQKINSHLLRQPQW